MLYIRSTGTCNCSHRPRLINLSFSGTYFPDGTAWVLDANPAHVKALYCRGMAYMAAGDFEEARGDFKMMMKIDKSSEIDATAALLKLKQKEQEIERKDRKQFKGLFD